MTATLTSLKSKACYTTVAITIGAVLAISGCKDGEINTLIDSLQQSKTEQQFCETKEAPFSYSLCQVSQDKLLEADSPFSLRLFWKSGQWQATEDGTNQDIVDQNSSIKPLFKFDNLIADLPQSSELKFAANAGMYNNEFAPIGYTVIQGKQILSLNLNQGAGNFHLMPNGVLWWNKDNRVTITESHKLDELIKSGEADPWYATQSGPMLVIDNEIHQKFDPNSSSKKVRNGVGVCEDHQIKFVTSREPVTFYQFASLFKQELGCSNALFLDGGVASALYAPGIAENDKKNMGVMVGLVEDHSGSQ